MMTTHKTRVLWVLVLATLAAIAMLAGLRPAEAAFPGVNGKIVFSSDRTRDAQDIFAISPSGGAPDRLTTFSTGHNIDPAVSPDGSRIAFSRDGQIWVMKASGMTAGGTGATQITNISTTKTRPTWSPDGSRIAYMANSFDVDGQTDLEVWIINADGSGRTQLTNNTVPDERPSWSPDGTQIAFVSARIGDSNRNIYLMDTNPATDDAINLTQNSTTPLYQGHDDFPSWSPDGTQITYSNNGDGDADVYKMDTNPTTKDWTNLTPNPSEDTDPAWSPDGNKIVYQGTTSTATDRNIYVMNSDGSSPAPVNTNTAHDISPDWQPASPTCDITGTSGNDTALTGTTADETICGLGGNDVINGGGGNDILMGGGGNDTLVAASGRGTLNGGDGIDASSFAGSATPIEASLVSAFARRSTTNPLEGVALVGIESLTGSSLGDSLTGSGGANKLVGGAGADEILGLGGKDKLHSRDGAKNDTVNGGPGTDACTTDNREISIKSCE